MSLQGCGHKCGVYAMPFPPSKLVLPWRYWPYWPYRWHRASSWYCPRMTRVIRVSLGPGTIWQVDGITCPRMVRVSSVVSIAMTTVSTVCMHISKWHTSSYEVLVLLKPKLNSATPSAVYSQNDFPRYAHQLQMSEQMNSEMLNKWLVMGSWW